MLDSMSERWEHGAVRSSSCEGAFVRAWRLWLQWVAVGLFLSGAAAAQTAAAPQADRSQESLGSDLNILHGPEIHIFFVHGIGAEGPESHDSLALRKSICAYLKDCLSPAGEQVGNYDYADEGVFRPGEALPNLRYRGRQVWSTQEEWAAAAPFAVHYKLERKSGGAVYVDELNWWPLVFALKCREIVAADAWLIGPSARIRTCSTREPDPHVQGRFLSYDWIPPQEAEQLLKLRKRGARINRTIKNNLSDWGFSDAILSLGPLHSWLVAGLRQLIRKSVLEPVPDKPGEMTGPRPDQEFVIVTQSLGSYLTFSALDYVPADANAPNAKVFQQVLRQTSLVYFFANQIPMLELANLDESPNGEFVSDLESWGRLHCGYEKSEHPDQPCTLPKIVALNDPSDLLTWRVPPLVGVEVHNYTVKNAFHWFWLIEDPNKAHQNYPNDKRAVREMLHPSREVD